MAKHVQQHYIPRFLLDQWAGIDRRLTAFRWSNGHFLDSRCSPKAVAKVQHLYSLGRNTTVPDTKLEREYFGPQIDDPAALVHKVLISHGSEQLSNSQRLTWSRFILAQLFRVPAAINWLRSSGRQLMLEQFEAMAKMAGQPQAMSVWTDPKHADTLDDEGLKVLNRAIESVELNKLILDGVWSVIESNCDVDAILSDAPVSHIGQLTENSFVLVLPISPMKIFVCASSIEDIDIFRRQPAKRLMKAMNRQFAKQSSTYIFATSPSHRALALKYLRC